MGYTSPAFAFSNWYVSPDPGSIEVNLKTPAEVGSSYSHFLDLAESCFKSPIQSLNTGLPLLLFFRSHADLVWHSPNFPGTHTLLLDYT